MEFEEIREWLNDWVREHAERPLSPPEWVVLECTWNNLGYAEMGGRGYAERYLKTGVAPRLWRTLTQAFGEKIRKPNCRFVLERRFLRDRTLPGSAPPAPPEPSVSPSAASLDHHWGSSPDASICYGRSQDLQTLQCWVEQKHYRLITVFGVAGIGKSVLVKRLAETLQEQYRVIWESLSTAPTVVQLTTRLLRRLAPHSLPDSGQPPLSVLIDQMRRQRCLIVLDGLDAVLRVSGEAGGYQPDCEAYREFFNRLSSIDHPSCVMITSRELPRDLRRNTHIRPFVVKGLAEEGGQRLFEHLELVPDSPEMGLHLFRHYGGNPLALQTVTAVIHSVYGRQMSAFLCDLKQGRATPPRDIDDQFQPVLARLSLAEQEVLYWLAIAHTPLSMEDLRDLIVSPQAKQRLPGITLDALQRRSLVEKQGDRFMVYPFMRDLLLRAVIDRSVDELFTGRPDLLNTHALLQAQRPDYVRTLQQRSIVQPIVEQLTIALGTRRSLVEHLKQLLQSWPTLLRDAPSYAIGNLVNLCTQVNLSLDHADLSHVHLRQAYLPTVRLLNVNLSYTEVSTAVFAKSLGSDRVIALDPAGTQLAVGDERGYIQVWQIETGQTAWSHLEGGSPITALDFSPGGAWLAIGDAAGAIHLWDAVDVKRVYTRLEHRRPVVCLSFSPDGRYLVSGSQDRTLRVLSVDTRQSHNALAHPSGITAIALSPDSQQVASLTDDQHISVWALETGASLNTFNVRPPYRIEAIAFTRRGHLIAAAVEETVIRVWELRTGRQFSLEGHTDSISALTFSPVSESEPQLLVSSSRDRTLKFWDIQTPNLLHTVSIPHHFSTDLTFSAHGSCLASNSRDRLIRVWDRSGRSRQTLHGYDCRVCAFALSPDSRSIAIGDDRCMIRLWHGYTGHIQHVLTEHRDWVSALAYSPQGDRLASGGEDGSLHLWNVQTGELLLSLPGHPGAIQTVVFSPDGHLLASGCSDGTVKVWRLATRECQAEFCDHTGTIYAIAFHPQGTLLASGSADQTIRLWDLATGRGLRVLRGHDDRVHTLCFDDNSQLLVSSSYDRTLRYWDTTTGICTRLREGDAELIHCIGRSPNGHLLLSGNRHNAVTLWDLTTQTVIGSLRRTPGITWAGFSPAGDRLITVQNNETVQVWNTSTQRCVQLLHTNTPYQDTNITGVKGIDDNQRHLLRLLGAVENV